MSFHQKCSVRSELDWTGLRWINGFSVSKITQDGQRSARELQRIQIIPYRRTDGGEEGASNFTRTWKLKSNSSDKCALRKKYPSSSKQWRQTSPYTYLCYQNDEYKHNLLNWKRTLSTGSESRPTNVMHRSLLPGPPEAVMERLVHRLKW